MLPQTTKYLTTVLIIVIGATFSLRTTLAISCAGCVDLDELNFDKTVARFPYALVKFDIAFPYGDKHEAFAEFAKSAHKITDDLLIATVGIKDYGENENKLLGERFGLEEKKFPGIFLFHGSTTKFTKLPDHLDVTLDNLKGFVTQNTALYIGREGCLKQFNELARKYANLDKAAQLERLKEAEKLSLALTKDNEKTSAKAYITYMQKINEKGYDFVEEETKRLLRLKAGKVTEAKRHELKNKLNVLESFRVTKLNANEANDEL